MAADNSQMRKKRKPEKGVLKTVSHFYHSIVSIVLTFNMNIEKRRQEAGMTRIKRKKKKGNQNAYTKLPTI